MKFSSEIMVYGFNYEHKNVVEIERIAIPDCYVVKYYVGPKNIEVVGAYSPISSDHFLSEMSLVDWVKENWPEFYEGVKNEKRK